VDHLDLTADDPRLTDWHRIHAEASHHGRDHALPWALEEVRAAIEHPVRRAQQNYVLGIHDGTPVAAGHLELPMLDNTAHAALEVLVDPAHRCLGHGAAMLSELERRARLAGRTVLDAEVQYPLGEAADGAWPGIAFARAHGYHLVQEEIQRTLDVPVPEQRLEELAALAAERHGGYRLETYVGDDEPPERAAAVAVLDATLTIEAPNGDRTDLEAAAVDPESDRQSDELRRAQRRTRVRSVAVTAGGEVVAYSDLMVAGFDPGRAHQWGTLVRRDHRGHRLGLATKVANLQRLQRDFPAVTTIPTWNAAANAHMVAVNEQLGYRVTEQLASWERRI
jgi:GNAT superfamily N-acetyltransferase